MRKYDEQEPESIEQNIATVQLCNLTLAVDRMNSKLNKMYGEIQSLVKRVDELEGAGKATADSSIEGEACRVERVGDTFFVMNGEKQVLCIQPLDGADDEDIQFNERLAYRCSIEINKHFDHAAGWGR